jgi:hypothetical protein
VRVPARFYGNIDVGFCGKGFQQRKNVEVGLREVRLREVRLRVLHDKEGKRSSIWERTEVQLGVVQTDDVRSQP